MTAPSDVHSVPCRTSDALCMLTAACTYVFRSAAAAAMRCLLRMFLGFHPVQRIHLSQCQCALRQASRGD